VLFKPNLAFYNIAYRNIFDQGRGIWKLLFGFVHSFWTSSYFFADFHAFVTESGECNMNWESVIDVYPTKTGLICKFCFLPIEKCDCNARKLVGEG